MKSRGLLEKIGPPLRSGDDHEALWNAVSEGLIETVSSDYAPYLEEAKHATDNIFDVPFGMPSVETLLPLTYCEGAAKGRISFPKMVQVLSENPARRFWLYPRKGSLQQGADADIVIFDPNEEWTISAAGLHTAADFTPYEGWRIRGRVVAVLLRGEVLLESGKLTKAPGVGRFVPQELLN